MGNEWTSAIVAYAAFLLALAFGRLMFRLENAQFLMVLATALLFLAATSVCLLLSLMMLMSFGRMQTPAPLCFPAAVLVTSGILVGRWIDATQEARTRTADEDTWLDCQVCGYDLTGNISGVCPECGTRIPGRPSRPATAIGPDRSGERSVRGRKQT